MIGRFRQRARRERAIAQTLYGAIVTQARRPVFYLRYGVPDTVDGRFDLIALHAILLFERMEGLGGELRQTVFDTFFADMDSSLREMGVGDLTVPRRIKTMAGAFYGRAAAYRPALQSGDAAELAAALARNLFSGAAASEAGPEAAADLAAYALAARAALRSQADAAILSGEVNFPDPSTTLKKTGAA